MTHDTSEDQKLTKRLVVMMTPDMHRQFKIAAVHDGREMSDIVRDFIVEYLNTK